MALGEAVKHVLWLYKLFSTLTNRPVIETPPMIILCDNKGVIASSNNPVDHDRTKHINIKHHFIGDCIERLQVNLVWVASKLNLADLLTKRLDKGILQQLTTLMGMGY